MVDGWVGARRVPAGTLLPVGAGPAIATGPWIAVPARTVTVLGMERFLLDLTDPAALTGEQIIDALVVLRAEQERRALAAADPGALIEDAFQRGFDSKGLPKDPWITDGILVAPGAKLDRSAMSHLCGFVRVGSSWVWEAQNKLEDDVRHLPGARQQMRSVTLVAVPDGEAIDLVLCRTRAGVHELTGVRSFIVSGDSLELISARTVRVDSHR